MGGRSAALGSIATLAAVLLVASVALVACSARAPEAVPISTTAAANSTAVLPSALRTAAPSPSVEGASAAPSPVATVAPKPTATPIPGTGTIVDRTHAFSITLASGWVPVPLDGSDSAQTKAASSGGSQLVAVLDTETAAASAKGAALFAMDLSTSTLKAGTFSMLEVQAAGPMDIPLNLLEPLMTGLLEQAPGVTNVASKIVTLPAGKAIRITYTLTTTTSGGQKVKLAGTDYVLPSSKHLFTVTFLVSSAAASSGRSAADSTMKTFKLR